jgi:tripartite-type tricarboxylate transporter receptor subunit TctC
VRDMVFLPSVSVLAPARTPASVVDKLSKEISHAVLHPDVAKRLEALGIDPVGNTPDEYAEQLRKDVAFYAQAVKTSGAKLD